MSGRKTLAVLALCAVVPAPGCGGPAAPRVRATPEASGEPVEFAYVTTDQSELSARTTRGRATALLFVTTYDLASQVVARNLESVLRSQRPRANGGAVVLEDASYAPLADAFKSSLGLSYPVAMADGPTRQGYGAFGKIERVPTLLVLDIRGRVTFRGQGALRRAEIAEALASASPRGFAPRP